MPSRDTVTGRAARDRRSMHVFLVLPSISAKHPVARISQRVARMRADDKPRDMRGRPRMSPAAAGSRDHWLIQATGAASFHMRSPC
jgi:hypothetical protein